jgi:hypothetical protein
VAGRANACLFARPAITWHWENLVGLWTYRIVGIVAMTAVAKILLSVNYLRFSGYYEGSYGFPFAYIV